MRGARNDAYYRDRDVIGLSDYQERSLAVARDLVAVGVPVFAAYADEGSATGYKLPQEWQRTDATRSHRALEMWRPGMALCAVMGHTLDLIDFDPRNGSPGAEFTAWPTPYATAATPSGGQHVFIASLHVGSRDGILPGVDVKGGRPDGAGRGFAFIAPTVRASKVDGSQQAYQWLSAPDAHMVSQLVGVDQSGAALAALIDRGRGGAGLNGGSAPKHAAPRPGWAAPSTELALFRPPARGFTQAEAWRYCEPWVRELVHAPDGRRNAALNDAAKVLSHFGEEFWSIEWAWETLVAAVPPKENGRRMWDARQTIASAYRSAAGDWRAERDWQREQGAGFPAQVNGAAPQGVAVGAVVATYSRIVSIAEHLDGTYETLAPTLGAVRDDGQPLLYPGKWHTVIGGTGSGKSWLGLLHAAEEVRAGRTVAYAHFEETSPAGTADRIMSMSNDPDWRGKLIERFKWLDCADSWAPGEFAYTLAQLDPQPSLVVLDGLNAACTRHGQDPAQVQAVGWYRAEFVTPATRNGAAVLSLGHPPKARDRQDERHGYGSTAWLDEVDGVGFRLRAHREHPIRRGTTGSAQLYSAKDRPGSVELLGRPHDVEGWVYLGSLCVDNATDPSGGVRAHLSAPAAEVDEGSPLDQLAQAIVALLRTQPEQRYSSYRDLEHRLQAAGVKFNKSDLAPALIVLEDAGTIERDADGGRAARAGWLTGQTPPAETDSVERAVS
jgi:hypothetical protein